MRTALRVAAIVLVVAVLAPALSAACPLCKEASSDGDKVVGGTSVWRGMYWSILFMVSAPFAMVGTMIVLIRRARRRHPAGASFRSQVPSSKLGPASKLET